MVELALYYGSSSYNSHQMTRLLNNIIYECQALGIETKTPDEIANMLNLWESERV
jgi:HD superfamily phosphohydrolase